MWAQQNIVEAQDNKFNIEGTNEEVYVAAAEAMLVGHTESGLGGGVSGLVNNISRTVRERSSSHVGKELSILVEPMNELPMIVRKHAKPRRMKSVFHAKEDADVFEKYDLNNLSKEADLRAEYAIARDESSQAYIIKRFGNDGEQDNQDQLAYSYLKASKNLSGKRYLDIEYHQVKGSYQTKLNNVIRLDRFHPKSVDLADALELVNAVVYDDVAKSNKTVLFFMQLMAMVGVLQSNSLLFRPTGGDLSCFKWRPGEHQNDGKQGDSTPGGTYTFYKYENLQKFDTDAYFNFIQSRPKGSKDFYMPNCGHKRGDSRANSLSTLPMQPERFMLSWNLLEAIHLTEEFSQQLGLTELPKEVQDFITLFNDNQFWTHSDAHQAIIEIVQKNQLTRARKGLVKDLFQKANIDTY